MKVTSSKIINFVNFYGLCHNPIYRIPDAIGSP